MFVVIFPIARLARTVVADLPHPVPLSPESTLPGGSVLIGGDYKPSAVISATAHVGLDRALDFLAGSTAVLQKVRSATGIPMSVASKAVTRLGTVLNALSLYNAVKTMQNEYQACMDF